MIQILAMNSIAINQIRVMTKVNMFALSAIAGGLFPLTASADICGAPWMYDGGEIRLAMSGNAAIQAIVTLKNVKQEGPDQCQADISMLVSAGNASVANKTETQFRLEVKQGRAQVIRLAADGKVEARAGEHSAQGSVGITGLESLSYAGLIAGEGQRLSGESYEMRMGMQWSMHGMSMSQMKMFTAKITSGEKVVGKQTQLNTPVGQFPCWPVHFVRSTRMGPMTVSGETVTPPVTTAKVIDWFCPNMSLVMKQEIVQSGQTSVVEVTLTPNMLQS